MARIKFKDGVLDALGFRRAEVDGYFFRYLPLGRGKRIEVHGSTVDFVRDSPDGQQCATLDCNDVNRLEMLIKVL